MYIDMQLTLTLHINLTIIISKHLELRSLHTFCEFPFPVYLNNGMILKWLYSKSPEIHNNHQHESKAG